MMMFRRRPLQGTGLARQGAPLLLLAVLAGCTPQAAKKPAPPLPPPPAPVAAPAPAPRPQLTLREIIDQYLLHGHYAEGEQALRDLLAAHPNDRSAKVMLHQLTVDPARELGKSSREYVVQAGDSYSTLAARYLGGAQRFLILARYNHAADPSVLLVGQTLRLPASAPAAPALGAATPVAGESTAAKVQRLQHEAATLLAQGHKDKALTAMDEALSLDPQLKPATTQVAALRQQLVGAYHQRAIVLYRDQNLDAAIALWDHILAIDPGYEPATVYRARALELKQRLKQF